jgi:hypothetical protein
MNSCTFHLSLHGSRIPMQQRYLNLNSFPLSRREKTVSIIADRVYQQQTWRSLSDKLLHAFHSNNPSPYLSITLLIQPPHQFLTFNNRSPPTVPDPNTLSSRNSTSSINPFLSPSPIPSHPLHTAIFALHPHPLQIQSLYPSQNTDTYNASTLFNHAIAQPLRDCIDTQYATCG